MAAGARVARQAAGVSFNWAAGLTWLLTLGLCLAAVQFTRLEIFIVGLPGWFAATPAWMGRR